MADQDGPQGTPIVTEDDLNQEDRWGSGQRIIEPDLLSETGKKLRETEEVEGEKKEDDLKPEELEETEEVEAGPTATLEDPGDFTPEDYSFEVTVFNKDGKNGKQVKVSTPEDWYKLIEGDDVNFGSASALLRAQGKATKMELGEERDRADWQRAKDAFEAEQQELQGREESLDNLVNEMAYLEERGDMPKVPTQFRDDWDSADARKDPAIKQQQELINYMDKENRARIRAGLKPETSLVSAFKSWKLDQMEKEEADSRTRVAQARREAGSRVSGSSPAPVSSAPKGIAVGRVLDLDHLSAGWR